MKHRIFLVEDHPVIRDAVRMLIEEAPDLEVTGEAGTAEDALSQIDQLHDASSVYDLVLVDISLPGMNGLELIGKIEGISVLVLTGHDADQYREKAERAGADGFVVKTHIYTQLLSAIRHVLQGKTWFDQASK